MAIRVYWETVKKWARKNKLVTAAGATSMSLVTILFFYLASIGAVEIIDYSPDYACAGTLEEPCYAYFTIKANNDSFIYPIEYDPYGRNTPFIFNPGIKSWKLERSWGEGWREIKLNETCSGTWCGGKANTENKFSYAFRDGREYNLRLTVIKNNPWDKIKWGAWDLDPAFLPIETTIKAKDRSDLKFVMKNQTKMDIQVGNNIFNIKSNKNIKHVGKIEESLEWEYISNETTSEFITNEDGLFISGNQICSYNYRITGGFNNGVWTPQAKEYDCISYPEKEEYVMDNDKNILQTIPNRNLTLVDGTTVRMDVKGDYDPTVSRYINSTACDSPNTCTNVTYYQGNDALLLNHQFNDADSFLYYKCDEIGTGSTYDLGSKGATLTWGGNAAINTTSSRSGAGSCLFPDKADSYMQTSSGVSQMELGNNSCIAAWVYPQELVNDQVFFDITNGEVRIFSSSTGSWRTETMYTTSSAIVGGTPTISDWNHVVFSMNDTGVSMWVDGGSKSVESNSFTGTTGTGTVNTIGTKRYFSDDMMGMVDELIVLNRSCTDTDVATLYAGGIHSRGTFVVPYTTSSADAINVSYNTREDDAQTSICFTVTGNTTLLCSNTTNILLDTTYDDIDLTFYYSSDNASKTPLLLNFTVSTNGATPDTTNPSVSISYPTNTTYTSNVTNITYTASDETLLDSCWWSNNSGVKNYSTECNVNISNIEDGLVSQWHLDGNANDEIGDNDGTVDGATLTDGLFNQSYEFDGINDYIDLGNPNELNYNSSDDFSISVWFKTNDTNGNVIFGKINQNNGRGYMLRISNNNNGKIQLHLQDADDGTQLRPDGSFIADNQWHHVVGVINRNNNFAYIYKDGFIDINFNISTIGNLAVDRNASIGSRNSDAPLYYYNGTIDEVRIYDKALNSTAITKLYQAGAGYFGKFEEGHHSITVYANDSSSNIGSDIIDFTVDTTEEPAPEPSTDVGFLSDACVLNRSCCAETTLDSSSICIRTDNQSMIGAENFTMRDIRQDNVDFGSDSNFALNTESMHYRGSIFKALTRASVNLPYGGIGQVWSAQNSGGGDIDGLLYLPCGTATYYVWRPDMKQVVCENPQGASPWANMEIRSTAISKYSFVIQASVKCLDMTNGCNSTQTAGKRIQFKHTINANADPYSLTNGSDITGTGRPGLISFNNDAAGTWSDSNTNYTFYIVANQTPDNITTNGRDGYMEYWLDGGESINLTFAILGEYDLNITEDVLANPNNYIDNHTRALNDYFNMYKIPTDDYSTQNNANMTRAIHHSIWGIYTSTTEQYGTWTSTLNNDVRKEGFVSAAGGYKGHWKWDGFFLAMGALAACKDGNQTCYEHVQDMFNTTFDHQEADGYVPQSIRYDYVESSAYQAPGGWDIIVRDLCTGKTTDSMWCFNAYQKLIKEHGWWRDNADSDGDNKFAWGGGSSGWDDSVRFLTSILGYKQNLAVEALDLQGWMILSAESILNLSYTHNTSNVDTYATYVNRYKTAADNFWDEDIQDYSDHISNTNTPIADSDGRRRTPANGWMNLAGVTNTTQRNLIYDMWYNADLFAPYVDGIGILPSLARNHSCFVAGALSSNPACSMTGIAKWNGRMWAPINLMNYLGALRGGTQNDLNNASYLRTQTLDTMTRHALTQESYNSEDGKNPQEGSFAGEEFPGFGDGIYSTILYEWDVVLNQTATVDDIMHPNVVITYPTNDTYSTNITYMTVSATDETALNNCWYNIGGSNISFPCTNTTIIASSTDGHNFWQIWANDTSGHIANTSVHFTVDGDYVVEVLNWKQKYDKVNQYMMYDTELFRRWSIDVAYYGEQQALIESQLLMFNITENTTYLDDAEVNILNLTRQHEAYTALAGDEFVKGHMEYVITYFTYVLNTSGVPEYEAKVPYYMNILETNFSEFDDYIVEFEYNGMEMASYYGDENLTTKPTNQWSDQAMRHYYLYKLTGNETYNDLAWKFARAINATFQYESCHYNESKTCHWAPYRFDYQTDWEDHETAGATSGLIEYGGDGEPNNYNLQQYEHYFTLYLNGFLDNATIETVANTIYYNKYIQEGGYDNVLFNRNAHYNDPSEYTDFHKFYMTHKTYNNPYYHHWESDILDISEVVMQNLYDKSDDGDDSFTFFIYPYVNITDPRNSVNYKYADGSEGAKFTGEMLMKYIATYLYQNVTLPAEDTCTYSGSGDHTFNAEDNCVLSSEVDMDGNSWYCRGTGTLKGIGNIVNYASGWIFGPCVAEN